MNYMHMFKSEKNNKIFFWRYSSAVFVVFVYTYIVHFLFPNGSFPWENRVVFPDESWPHKSRAIHSSSAHNKIVTKCLVRDNFEILILEMTLHSCCQYANKQDNVYTTETGLVSSKTMSLSYRVSS